MKQHNFFLFSPLRFRTLKRAGILAVAALIFASCGDNDASDGTYAGVEGESFTFDETDVANNTIRVLANTAWQVYWEPSAAAVRVTPASGFGDGSFCVQDMPRGTSVGFGVRTASGKASGWMVSVTRADEPVETTLSVSPASLAFDPASDNRITVTSNASWTASCPDSELLFAPASGTGDGTIAITGAPAGRSCTLTVTAGEGAGAKSRGVEIVYMRAEGYRWAELPATPADMTNKKIHTYWASTVTSKQYLRNYTYCYDTYRHCPLWIAHPQHACYQEGSGRTDVWKKDAYMTDAEQAIIYPLPDVNGNRALSLYSESVNRQWTRGHMLMSNYRAGKGEEINAQTFYSCNIAPQGGTAFDRLWAAAENRIQDKYVCADTLYCVSGAYFENDDLKARDASGWNTVDGVQVRYYVPGYSKECVVPTHYYKLVLRTRSGNTGKPVQECKAEDLKAVGFWFEHADQIGGSSSPTLDKSCLRSVAWIEQKTGFTFFPDVPASVKEQCVASDWGL